MINIQKLLFGKIENLLLISKMFQDRTAFLNKIYFYSKS